MAWGKQGADELGGGDGNDFLEGGESEDEIDGFAHADQWGCGGVQCALEGEKNQDRIDGGDGPDFADGGLANDSISGDVNDDDLNAWTDSDGGDIVYGNQGNDHCYVNQSDTWFTCEHVHTP